MALFRLDIRRQGLGHLHPQRQLAWKHTGLLPELHLREKGPERLECSLEDSCVFWVVVVLLEETLRVVKLGPPCSHSAQSCADLRTRACPVGAVACLISCICDVPNT